MGRPETKNDMEDIGFGYRIYEKTNFKGVGFQGADWLHTARDRVKWWDVLNAVINHRVPYNAGSFDSHRKNSF